MAPNKNPAGSNGAKFSNRIAQPLAILSCRSGTRRARRPGNTKRQVAAERPNTSIGKSPGDRYQQLGLCVRSCTMGQDRAVGPGLCRPVKKTPGGTCFEYGYRHRRRSEQLIR